MNPLIKLVHIDLITISYCLQFIKVSIGDQKLSPFSPVGSNIPDIESKGIYSRISNNHKEWNICESNREQILLYSTVIGFEMKQVSSVICKMRNRTHLLLKIFRPKDSHSQESSHPATLKSLLQTRLLLRCLTEKFLSVVCCSKFLQVYENAKFHLRPCFD